MQKAPPVVGYVMLSKANAKGSRWKKVAVVRTIREGLALQKGSGSWWFKPITDPAILQGTNAKQAGLFDDDKEKATSATQRLQALA